MVITQSDTSKKITISNPIEVGFGYVHAVVKVGFSTAILVDSNIVNSTSEFTLDSDSLYYLVSIKLPTTIPVVEGVFYIYNNVVLQYNDPTEYSVADLLNLDSEETSFINDIEEQFIIHRYNIVKNYNTILKEIAKNTNICLTNSSLNSLRDTLMMGIYVIDILVANEQWNTANIIVFNMQMCSGITNLSSNFKCNCNG